MGSLANVFRKKLPRKNNSNTCIWNCIYLLYFILQWILAHRAPSEPDRSHRMQDTRPDVCTEFQNVDQSWILNSMITVQASRRMPQVPVWKPASHLKEEFGGFHLLIWIAGCLWGIIEIHLWALFENSDHLDEFKKIPPWGIGEAHLQYFVSDVTDYANTCHSSAATGLLGKRLFKQLCGTSACIAPGDESTNLNPSSVPCLCVL